MEESVPALFLCLGQRAQHVPGGDVTGLTLEFLQAVLCNNYGKLEEVEHGCMQPGLNSLKKADRCTNVFCTETGYVDLGVLHWLPLGTGGAGMCPIKVAVEMNWLRRLEGVAELRVIVHSCFLSHRGQTGADFGPQLPAGAGLLPLKVVNHCGGTGMGQNNNAQQPMRVIAPKYAKQKTFNRSYAAFLFCFVVFL